MNDPQSLSRRDFLAQSAVAASALTVAGGVSTARSADSPNESVVLGVMGVNGRGAALAKGFAGLSNTRVAYVCDVDSNAVDRNMRTLGDLQSTKPEGVKDFRKILDDKAVDALVIAAPDHWHGPATIMACAAGKHVYVEKPACHNPREGLMMIEAARKHKRVVQMGTQRRSSPQLRECIERMQAGEVGRVLFARGWINSTRPSIGKGKVVPVPAHLDFDLWQGPAPEVEYRDNLVHYNWHWFWNWGTGELGNNGVHSLDICRWGLGVDYPQRITCGGGKFHFNDDQETPDTQLATFSFGDKAIAWEHRTWSLRGFEGELFGAAFYGEKGAMIMAGNKVVFYDMKGKELESVPVKVGETEHLTNFLDGIRDGKPLNQEIEDGVKSTMLCLLGNIAYRTGHTLDFDPKKREIVGDPAAQALWGREYRKGWEPKV
jgi:predicted dehydrogenase